MGDLGTAYDSLFRRRMQRVRESGVTDPALLKQLGLALVRRDVASGDYQRLSQQSAYPDTKEEREDALTEQYLKDRPVLGAYQGLTRGAAKGLEVVSWGLLPIDEMMGAISRDFGGLNEEQFKRQLAAQDRAMEDQFFSKSTHMLGSGLGYFVGPGGAIKGLRATKVFKPAQQFAWAPWLGQAGGKGFVKAGAQHVGSGAVGFGLYEGIAPAVGQMWDPSGPQLDPFWTRFGHGAKMGALAEVLGPAFGAPAKRILPKSPRLAGMIGAAGTGAGLGLGGGGGLEGAAIGALGFAPIGALGHMTLARAARSRGGGKGLDEVAPNITDQDLATFGGRRADSGPIQRELGFTSDPPVPLMTGESQNQQTLPGMGMPLRQLYPLKPNPTLYAPTQKGLGISPPPAWLPGEHPNQQMIPGMGSLRPKYTHPSSTQTQGTPIQQATIRVQRQAQEKEVPKAEKKLAQQKGAAVFGDPSFTALAQGQRAAHLDTRGSSSFRTETEVSFTPPNKAELRMLGLQSSEVPGVGTFRYNRKAVNELIQTSPDLNAYREWEIKGPITFKSFVRRLVKDGRLGALLEYGEGNAGKEGATHLVTGRDAQGREILTVAARDPEKAATALQEKHGAEVIQVRPAQEIQSVLAERAEKGATAPKAPEQTFVGLFNDRVLKASRKGAPSEASGEASARSELGRLNGLGSGEFSKKVQLLGKHLTGAAKRLGLSEEAVAQTYGFEALRRGQPDPGFELFEPVRGAIRTAYQNPPTGKGLDYVRRLERLAAMASLPAEGKLAPHVQGARDQIQKLLDQASRMKTVRKAEAFVEQPEKGQAAELAKEGITSKQSESVTQGSAQFTPKAPKQGRAFSREYMADLIKRMPIPADRKQQLLENPEFTNMNRQELDAAEQVISEEYARLSDQADQALLTASRTGESPEKIQSTINTRMQALIDLASARNSAVMELKDAGEAGEFPYLLNQFVPGDMFRGIRDAWRHVEDTVRNIPSRLRFVDRADFAEGSKAALDNFLGVSRPALTRTFKESEPLAEAFGNAIAATEYASVKPILFNVKMWSVLPQRWMNQLFWAKRVSEMGYEVGKENPQHNIPLLSPREEALYNKYYDQLFKPAEQLYREQWLPAMEQWAADAGIRLKDSKMHVTLHALKGRDLLAVADMGKFRGGISGVAKSRGYGWRDDGSWGFDPQKAGDVVNIAKTSGRKGFVKRLKLAHKYRIAGAAKSRKGTGEFYSLDGLDLLSNGTQDRYGRAMHNKLIEQIKREAPKWEGTENGDPVTYGKVRDEITSIDLDQMPRRLKELKGEGTSEALDELEIEGGAAPAGKNGGFKVPKSLAILWDRHINTPLTETNRAYRNYINTTTGIMLMSGAEAAWHSLNVIGGLMSFTKVGPDKLSRGLAWLGGLPRFASTLHGLWDVRGPEAERDLEILSRKGNLRAHYFKEAEGWLERSIIGKVMAPVREYVFGMPRLEGGAFDGRGLRGLETRARLAAFRALRRVDPNISAVEAGIIIDNHLGAYVNKLAPHIVRAVKSTGADPFASPGLSIFKAGINTISGRGPFAVTRGTKAGWKISGPELVTSTVGTAAQYILLQVALDEEHRLPWNIPGLRFLDLRIPIGGGKTFDLPFGRIFTNPIYRVMHHLGIREITKENSKDPDDPLSAMRVTLAGLRGVSNGVMGRMGPGWRSVMVAGTGHAPYFTSDGKLLSVEKDTQAGLGSVVKARAMAVLETMIPQFGEQFEMVDPSWLERFGAAWGMTFPKHGPGYEAQLRTSPSGKFQQQKRSILFNIAQEAGQIDDTARRQEFILSQARARLQPVDVLESVGLIQEIIAKSGITNVEAEKRRARHNQIYSQQR